ncbi:PepSY-associated TM helix domain-containing protein [Herbaspirillum lusitanum]|uniref:PepSY-associated TM helix domain-containing protein n=1 Tax=Herbaspirillum lusitanum TaxID=213312 RepID=A0ABW9ADS2_9BURK
MMVWGIRLPVWRRLHRWSSLGCTIFLLLSCLSGLPLIFSDEIEALIGRPPALSGPALAVTPGDLDAMAAAATRRYPHERVRFIFFDRDEGQIKVVMGSQDSPDRSRDHPLVFDGASGRLVDEPPSLLRRRWEFMPFVQRLHTELLSGFAGEMVLAAVGLLALMAVLSGVALYGPYMKNQAFGALRRGRRRTWWLDLHNLIGIATAVWVLAITATGIINEFAKPLAAVWRSGQMSRLAASGNTPVPFEALPSIQAARDAAAAALPDNNVTSIILPSRSFSNPAHYLIWTNGNTPLTHRLFSAVLVDARSNKAVAVAEMPGYLRSLQLARPLHFGDYGGFPLKLIWGAFDVFAIFLLLSGLYLWLKRPMRA